MTTPKILIHYFLYIFFFVGHSLSMEFENWYNSKGEGNVGYELMTSST